MLLVLRHGPTAWNVPPKRCQGQIDVELSDAGRNAARTRGASLPSNIAAAYASPLSRARETAEILLDAAAEADTLVLESTPQEVVVDGRLSEVNCGAWEGELHETLARKWPAEWAALGDEDPAFTFPAGESLAALLERFTEVIGELDARHAGETALVVSHGGCIRNYLVCSGVLTPAAPGSDPKNLEGFTIEGGRVEPTWKVEGRR